MKIFVNLIFEIYFRNSKFFFNFEIKYFFFLKRIWFFVLWFHSWFILSLIFKIRNHVRKYSIINFELILSTNIMSVYSSRTNISNCKLWELCESDYIVFNLLFWHFYLVRACQLASIPILSISLSHEIT